MFDLSVACAGLVATLCASVLYRYWKKHAISLLPLPPSPKPYPLIGNLLSMPSKDEHVGFLEIGKDLNSDIYSLRVFGTLIIVLNSSEHTTNLLEKRAGIYSDRICPPMVDWGNFPTILGYNDQWRKGRRLLHPWLHKKATERFQPAQQHQAHLLLQRLLNSSDHMRGSEELDVELYRSAAATLADSVYGYKVESSNDQFVLDIKQALTNVGETALPSNFLVNLFPILVHVPDWFPGTAWKQIAREWRVHQKNAVNAPYQWAKEQIAKGSHEPYITLAMLDQAERLGMEKNEAEELIKQLDVALFGVGAETTATVLMHFVLAMLLFPETQEAAQKEIDSVVGTNRLPSMDDRPKLEYVERLLQEVLRWRPVLPNGVAHACYQNDEYMGYSIPKGALVIGNIWAITRNPNVYKDPEMFNPDRFIDPAVPHAPVFGFGRRLCPGIHYAKASIFITMASILSTFQIELAKDDDGNDIVPTAKCTNSLVSHPKPFKFKLTPRSRIHEDLIRAVL